MKQFHVPQFITVEDTVFGPLTIKQALYVGGGLVAIFIARTLFVSYIFYPLAAIIGGFMGAMAFLKMNGQPFAVIVKNAFFYIIRPRIYLWKKEEPERRKPEVTKKGPEVTIKSVPKISESRLSDLAWSLDIKHTKDDNEDASNQPF